MFVCASVECCSYCLFFLNNLYIDCFDIFTHVQHRISQIHLRYINVVLLTTFCGALVFVVVTENKCTISAAVFTLVSLLVIVIALVCLIQLHTRLLDKFLPETTYTESVRDEQFDEHTALQTVRDFKYR